MLKVNNINVYYGSIHAIKDVSFEVHKGEVVTLIGANGAGKSTILQTVSGLLHSKTGSVEFLGQNISAVRPDKIVSMGLAHVPEGRRVFLQLTVEENLEMGAYTRPGSEFDASIKDVYERFPRLLERRKQVAGTLSGGEQQRVSIARALAKNPKLLLCDEPTGALDYNTGKAILKLLQDTCREKGMTVILITHNSAIAPMADRVIQIKNGKVSKMTLNPHPVSVETIEW